MKEAGSGLSAAPGNTVRSYYVRNASTRIASAAVVSPATTFSAAVSFMDFTFVTASFSISSSGAFLTIRFTIS